MFLHLDPVGGVAGDMFAAAMLDAFPHLAAPLTDVLAQFAPLAGIRCLVQPHHDHTLTGTRFSVEKRQEGEADRARNKGHGHSSHAHHAFRHIRSDLIASDLAQPVKDRAIAIFQLLAEAEAKVHGSNVEDVTFHEVGNWDSIADIVSAAFLIDAVSASGWSIGPLPLGSGRVESAHGQLPLPAPAVVLLLEGFPVFDDGIAGERVTPTGAAIIRHLQCKPEIGSRPRRLASSGIGFGTRVFENSSNVLRVFAFEELGASVGMSDEVAVLAFEIDDQTGEDLAAGLERLRAHAGVLQVTQTPGFGKKGRMLVHVQVLAHPDDLEDVSKLCFLETSTLGVRRQIVTRTTLERDSVEASVDSHELRVKRAKRPDGTWTAKAEMDDIDRAVSGRSDRDALRRAAEGRAVRRGGDEDQ